MSAVSAADLHDVFAVMALLALGGTVVMGLARVVPAVAAVRFLDGLHRIQLPLAALVATTASLGSLWFSEVADWEPCRFCWFQRIFMYSSAVVLIVASIRRDRSARWYVVPLAGIGALVSGWHLLLENRIVEESTSCTSLVSCANPYYVSFGTLDFSSGTLERTGFPVTLAVMALSGFLAVIALLLAPEALDPTEDHDGQPTAS